MAPKPDPKVVTLTVGPYIGVNDTPNLAAQDGQRAAYIENMYAPAASVQGDLISRPGFTRRPFARTLTGTVSTNNGSPDIGGTGTAFLTELAIGDLVTINGQTKVVTAVLFDTAATASSNYAGNFSGTGTSVDAGIDGGVLHLAQFSLTSGTQHSLVLGVATNALYAGGADGFYRFLDGAVRIKLAEYNHTTAKYTDRTSATMDGVALDKDIRIYSQTFANYWIPTDGTNRPRKIDGSWVLSNLTDGNYAFQGPLRPYYGKLFGIDASDAITIRWSEENDPDTGYGTGTSDNSWSLRQTSADQLSGLIGSNDALYVARNGSLSIITGAAASDFRSSGTVDAIQNIGTRSPDTLCLVNDSIVFLDQNGRVGRIQPGYGYIPLWKRIQELMRGVGLTNTLLRAAWCRFDPVTNLVKIGYRASGSATTNDQVVVFDAESWECLGIHKVYATSGYTVMDHAFSAIWLDENNKSRHAIASASASDCAVYIQQTEDAPAASARDVTSGGSVTVACTIAQPKVGGDPLTEKHFHRVDVGIRNVGGGAAGLVSWKRQHRTPYADYSSAVAMQALVTSGTYDGAATKAVGSPDATGRWVQFKFTNDTSGAPATRATFDTMTVRATETSEDVKVR